jgi:hypothetical protein
MTKGDSRNVVIIGYSPEAIQLKKLLNQEMIMAIIFGYFSDKQENIEMGN